MKVLHLTMEYPPNIDGGVGIFSENLCSHLALNDVDVSVITKNSQIPYNASLKPMLKIYRANNLPVLGLQYPTYILQVIKFINMFMGELEKSETVIHGAIPNTILGVKKKFPTVVTVHHLATTSAKIKRDEWKRILPWSESFIIPISPIIERKMLMKADHVVAVSKGTANEIIKHFGVSSDKISIIHNGIPNRVKFNTINKRRVTDPLQFPEGTQYFLFVGGLNERKGIRILLKAISKIDNQDFRFVLVGEGSKRMYYQYAKKLNIQKRVVFAGYVSNEILMLLYQQSSGFILPSFLEGFPTVLIEAMYYGNPIICSNTDGGREIVIEGKNGFLFPLGDVNLLANLIMRLINDEDLRKRIGKFNKIDVKKRFNWDVSANKYKDLFLSLIGK